MPDPRGLILVVDDEAVVLRLTSSVLSAAGYGVLVAENAVAALACFGEEQDSILLVLADVSMPGMNGLEMARRMQQVNPAVRILFMSGYTDAAEEVEARQHSPFLRKPFLPEDLVRKVRETIAGPLLS
jgi:two-component system, cell cycle sensor histidine kinase and response regulator CckA